LSKIPTMTSSRQHARMIAFALLYESISSMGDSVKVKEEVREKGEGREENKHCYSTDTKGGHPTATFSNHPHTLPVRSLAGWLAGWQAFLRKYVKKLDTICTNYPPIQPASSMNDLLLSSLYILSP